MSSFSTTSKVPSKASSRPKYTIRPDKIVEVLSHRNRRGTEEYLVRWRTKPVFPCPPRAIASWHALPELRNALHHVQAYIEKNNLSSNGIRASLAAPSRKRKWPEDDAPLSRGLGNNANGLLTPEDSVIDLSTPEPEVGDGPLMYNGYFQYKEGYIIAKKDVTGDAAKINTKNLPTQQMSEEAARTPVNQAEIAIRNAFDDKLQKVKRVRLENNFDSSTPNLHFDFITDYVLREGVSGEEPSTFQGCQQCKPNMGGNVGCEYTKKCDCLEFAPVDEKELERTKPEIYQVYQAMKSFDAASQSRDDGFETTGMPKRFPYSKPSPTGRPQTLAKFYLESRHPIYECNVNCKCGPGCKSRVVQKGRRVPLVIFKTGSNKGWGVYCEEDLIKGEFIDVYLGEVITDEETTRRGDEASDDKASYLYSLDKFVGDRDPMNNDEPLQAEDCYVVDGQYMGNVTRFMNHSCEPNVRQYTVSYNKHDLKLYHIAFFACEDIPAGTELVFDYMDKEPEETLDDAVRKREARLRDPDYADFTRCRCGAESCRGYLWDKDVVEKDWGSSQRTT